MFHAPVNFFAVLLGAIANMALGFFWYSPNGFGTQWMEAMGKTKEECEGMKQEASKAYASSFVGALIMSWVLGYLVYYLNSNRFFEGVQVGFIVWLGFVATTMFNSCLFENKPKNLVLINAGYYLAALIVMSVIHSLMGA